MDKRLLDTVTVITALVLIPMVAASQWALYTGTLTLNEYAAMWREPLALLLGFWLRDVSSK